MDRGLRQKTFGLRAIEARMHSGNVVEGLRNFDPAWKYGDIRDERHIAHEQIALGPRVTSQHTQFSFIRSEAENRIERGSLARAVGPDQSEDAALFHAHIDAVERDSCAESLAETACFYAGHDFSAPPFGHWNRNRNLPLWNSLPSRQDSPASIPRLSSPRSVRPASTRAVESRLQCAAILRRESAGVRPAAADRALPY